MCLQAGDSTNGYDFCSDSVTQFGLKLQSCPKQTNCGSSEALTAPVDQSSVAIKQDQSSSVVPKFTKSYVCHYTVAWPAQAKKGDVLYLNVITLQKVDAFVLIGQNITQSYFSACNGLQAGDYLIAQYPNKFFLSFVSEASDQTAFYYMGASYSTSKSQQYQNDVRCVGVANQRDATANQTDPNADPGTVTGNKSTVTDMGQFTLQVASPSQLLSYTSQALVNAPLETIAMKDDQTFDWVSIVMLSLGCVFFLVSLIMLAECCYRYRKRWSQPARVHLQQPDQQRLRGNNAERNE